MTVGEQETSCFIDCDSTLNIVREDMATAFDLNITNNAGAIVNGMTGDKLVPIGKAHMKMTIEDSIGQRVHVHFGERHTDKVPGWQQCQHEDEMRH
jgi:hypothetical protein